MKGHVLDANSTFPGDIPLEQIQGLPAERLGEKTQPYAWLLVSRGGDRI